MSKVTSTKGIKLEINQLSESEITIKSHIKGSLEKVYAAHVDPEAIPHWWGPSYLTTQVLLMDVRVGGKWHYKQTDPNGNIHEFYGKYVEIIPNSKITWTFTYGGFPEYETVESIEFKRIDNNNTEIFVNSKYPSKEALAGMLEGGMEDGYYESLTRLEEYVK